MSVRLESEVDWDALEAWLLGRPLRKRVGTLPKVRCPRCGGLTLYHDDESGDHQCLMCPWSAVCRCS